MRIDLGLVLAIILEGILFVYYADTLFYRKREKYFCYAVIALGYAMHGCICIFGNVIVNALVFIAANFLSFVLCYHIDYKNALFQSAMLLLLSGASEWIVAYIPYFEIPSNPLMFSPTQSFILTMISAMLYLIEIMIVSHLFNSAKYSRYTPAAAMI